MQHEFDHALAATAALAGLAAGSPARAASCAGTLLSHQDLTRFAALAQ